MELDFENLRTTKDKTTRYIPILSEGKRVYIPFKHVMSGSKPKLNTDETQGTVCITKGLAVPKCFTSRAPTIEANTNELIDKLDSLDKLFKSWVPAIKKNLKLKSDTTVYSIRQDKTEDGITLDEPIYRVKLCSGKFYNLKEKKGCEFPLKDMPKVVRRGALLGGTLNFDSVCISKSGISLIVKFNIPLGVYPAPAPELSENILSMMNELDEDESSGEEHHVEED